MASLMPNGKQQYFSNAGVPLVGGKVYTYVAGTTTPLATYTDSGGGTPNTNPVILDSRGEASIFFSTSAYKIVLKDSTDSTIWTQDNLYPETTTSDLVVYTPAGTGAVPTTVQTKLRESVSVKDFGAVADWNGTTGTDNTSAFNKAIAAASAAGIGLIKIPSGFYMFGTPLAISSSVTLQGDSFGLNTRLIYNNASAAFNAITLTGAYSGLQNLYITTKNATLGAVYRQDTSHTKDSNLVIEGNFRYGWHHKYTGAGGYYNDHDDIYVTLAASTYVDNIGIWCESYYSASKFNSGGVTNCVTGIQFDYANAVTLDGCAVENCSTQGIYVGASTNGLSIQSPYFEGNPVNKSVVCATGANNIDLNYMRGGYNINQMFTHTNQIRIDGGLRSFIQQNSTKNLLKNATAELKKLTAGVTSIPYWNESNTVTTQQVSPNANGFATGLRVTVPGATSFNQVYSDPIDHDATYTGKTLTLSGYYYVPSANTKNPRISIVGNGSSLTLLDLTSVTRDVYTPFTLSVPITEANYPITISLSPSWGAAAGGEYIAVAGLVLAFGEYFSPVFTRSNNYLTYREEQLVTQVDQDYLEPKVFCGYTAISSGAATITVTYPSWFAPTKILCALATSGGGTASNTNQAVQAVPTLTNCVFNVPANASAGNLKVWFEIKGQ